MVVTSMLRGLLCAGLLLVVGEAHAQQLAGTADQIDRPRPAPDMPSTSWRACMATGVSQTLGQTVYVENMPGASGFLGAQTTARAEPDGYTLLFAPASLLSSNMYLFKSLPYDPTKDFAAVAMVCDKGPMVVTVNPDLPVKTVPELIAYGKANPGKLSYAVDATSGFGVATGRLLNKRGQIGMVEIPYRSSPQMAQDTMAGNMQLMVGSMPPVAGAVKAGKLRWIAVSSEQRFPGLDELPTIAETLPGFRIDGWFVVVAPAKNASADPAAVESRDRCCVQIAGDPTARSRLRPRRQRCRHAGLDRSLHPLRAGALAWLGDRARHGGAVAHPAWVPITTFIGDPGSSSAIPDRSYSGLFARYRSRTSTSSAVMTSPNCWITFSSALRCSSSDSAAQQSSTRTTLKSSIMASRAVDSQQTFVLVPATKIVSIPMPRSERSSGDEPGIKAL